MTMVSSQIGIADTMAGAIPIARQTLFPLAGTLYVDFNGTTHYASVPDAAGFSALTNFSVAALVAPTDWTPASSGVVMGQQITTTNQRSWTTQIRNTGTLRGGSSTAGTAEVLSDSTVGTGFVDGTPHWLLSERTSVTGVWNFFTANPTTVDPPAFASFTRLGTADIANSVTGAEFDSTAALQIASQNLGAANLFAGRVYRAILYSGFYSGGGPTILVDFDPRDSTGVGATTWSEGTYTWTCNAGCAVATT